SLGGDFFPGAAHFAFFSLNGRPLPLHFPAVSARLSQRCDAIVRDVHPPRWIPRRRRWPMTIDTAPVAWQYAAVMDCAPSADIPAGVQPMIRVRAEASGGAVGMGLLSADRTRFVESRRVPPTGALEHVFMPIADRSLPPRLVVHTWDEPVPGRARIEDISFVW